MSQQKISPARIFLLFSIIVSVGVVLGLLLAIGKIGQIEKIHPPTASDEFCSARILEDCDGKKVSLKGILKYISKGPIPFLTNIENREVKYAWSGGVFLVWPNGGIPNTIEGTEVHLTGKVFMGGDPCYGQCLASYRATQIEVESFDVVKIAENVVISTDKAEYEQGEKIKIQVKNNKTSSVYIPMEEWSYSNKLYKMRIEEFKSNKWILLDYSFVDREKCGPFGQGPAIGCVEIKSNDLLERLKSPSYFKCYGEFPNAESEEINLPPGKYRLRVDDIAEKCLSGSVVDSEKTPLSIYSSEFTIKEKSAIDPRCNQKVDLVPCRGNTAGYEFDASEIKCVEKIVMEQCAKTTPFTSLEECQKTCETKIVEELPFTVIKGFRSTQREKANYVIKSKAEWVKILTKTDAELLAPIDFTKDMIIAAFQGAKTTGGYSIEITKIIENKNNIEVFVREISPGPSCEVTMALTNPYHIVKIQKSEKEVVFNVGKVVNDCKYF